MESCVTTYYTPIAANRIAAEELSKTLQNPKIGCRVKNKPPLVAILSQMDPVHIILSNLHNISFAYHLL
jgi:hypothetical protein